MRVIIAGGMNVVKRYHIDTAVAKSTFIITQVICGGAAGADTLGREWAQERRIPVKTMNAKWDDLDAPGAIIKTNGRGQYNARAGHDRNAEMAKVADGLILVWDGKSKGSANMLAKAKKAGIKIYQHIV